MISALISEALDRQTAVLSKIATHLENIEASINLVSDEIATPLDRIADALMVDDAPRPGDIALWENTIDAIARQPADPGANDAAPSQQQPGPAASE